MSWNSGANANLVQTRLDAIVKEVFDRGREPQEVMADDPLFFKQESFDKGSYVHEEIEGPGPFFDTSEEQDVNEAAPRSGNLVTTRIRKYALDLPVPDEAFSDAQLGAVEYNVRMLSQRARLSRDDFAYRQTYGNAFSATTPDGQAICANAHVTLSGDTVDNLETGAFTAANLEVVVRSLRRQRAQDGQLAGHVASGLLVALNLAEDAFEVTKSELAAHTGENQKNYWSNIYPGLRVGTSAFLHSDYNAGLNSNVNTSYFVVSDNHQMTRVIRQPLTTSLVEPKYDKKDRWFYKGRFREVCIPKSWNGIVGSNGTA